MNFETWLQSRLTAHGFPVGPIDGRIGPKTIAALAAFQKQHGIPATGVADQVSVEALRKTASEVDFKTVVDREITYSTDVVKNFWPRQRDVSNYYGAVGRNQVLVSLPYEMKLAWDKSHTISRISLHEKVADSASRCFERIADAYSPEKRSDLGVDLFGGSLNVRKMRGGSAYSMHSWGIAIDFDPIRNQFKWGRDKARLAKPDAELFWRIWEDEGWVSLGRSRNFDWMHIQAARL